MLTRLLDNLLKSEHHAGLKKLSRWITKTHHSKYSFARSAHQWRLVVKMAGRAAKFISGWTYRIVALPLAVYNGVSSHSSSPKLIKLVIYSCPYWYIENVHFSLMKPNPNLKHEHKRVNQPVPSKVWRITSATKAIKARVEPRTARIPSLEHSARLLRYYC